MSRPFDEARYRGLLEGLEVAEIHWSTLERTKRLDAEFFHPRHLRIAEILAAHATQPITEVAAVSDGNHFAVSEEFVEEGIPYYRGQDAVGHFFIEQSAPNYISEKAFRQSYMTRSHLKRGDVLLSIIGTIGEVGLVADESPATCSCKLAILRPRDVVPEYLAVFLRSIYGRNQVERFTRGAVQMGLLLEDMDQIRVARQAPEFESLIASIVACAKRTQEAAVKATEQAEQTLLRALGLDNWQPPEPLTYTRSSRAAFAAGRLDAEYFYPAKQAALEKLAALPGRTVGEMFSAMREMWQPEDAPANQPIRNYDLTDALTPFLGTETEPVYPSAIASTKKRIQPGDLVVSRLRSYLREIAVVLVGDDVPMVASTEFIVLRPKADAMRVEALLVYLRSTLPQLIFKWSQDGSNHPRFDEKELLNLCVPDIVLAKQDQLAAMLKSTILHRRRAAELLEAAKRAVEIAIESGEASALEFLNREIAPQ